MVKRRRMTQADWDRYSEIIQDFVDGDAGQQKVYWLRKINAPDPYGEDSDNQYQVILLNGLIQYNFIRTWPMNKPTVSGELEGANQVMYTTIRQIQELGFVKSSEKFPLGYWDFNWAEDRFIINGKAYSPEGDTQVAQAYNAPLLFSVILQRTDPTEAEWLLDYFKDMEPINNYIIDTSGGTITPETVVEGYVGYSKGVEVVGELDLVALHDEAVTEGQEQIIAAQADATITPEGVLVGEIGYGKDNTRVVGTLDPGDNYDQGFTDGEAHIIELQADATVTPEKLLKDEVAYGVNNTRVVGTFKGVVTARTMADVKIGDNLRGTKWRVTNMHRIFEYANTITTSLNVRQGVSTGSSNPMTTRLNVLDVPYELYTNTPIEASSARELGSDNPFGTLVLRYRVPNGTETADTIFEFEYADIDLIIKTHINISQISSFSYLFATLSDIIEITD